MSSVRRVRRATTVVSAVVCAALVLGACGGGDDDSTDDPIPGVDQGATEDGDQDDTGNDADTEAPEEDVEGDADSDRPEIDLGDDFENVYEDDETGDETTDAILRDSRGYFDAVDAAIIHQDTEHPALSYYIAGDALAATMDLIVPLIEANRVPIGEARIYNRAATAVDDSTATVSFCREFSDVSNVDKGSGEVLSPPDPDAKAALYTTRLELNDDGVWQTVEYGGAREADECA
ncbi:hypothetical protein [Streptomyces spiramenti]|uniref:Lipoprotein n=1 Tax=Streptomyces spiramenti TaxID=2720606 RepID=A0ABX1AG11_9ACTN|nr:hypothetical protein [Streptomyces spiramenti]NJP66127.1 hypothetical protein [Streptomyces spiramenti]